MGPEGGRRQGRDGPRSPPPRPRLASGPRPRCVPRPAPRRPPLPGCSGRGGEGKEPAGRRGGLNPAPPPSCGPRGRRGSPPAPCSPVCWPARRPCPGAAAACSGPGGRRRGAGASGRGAAGSTGPVVAAGRRGHRGEARRAGWGGHGPRPESPLSGTGLRRAGRPGGGWLGLTPSVGRASSARQKAVRQLGEWKVVVGPLCHLGLSLGTEDLLSAHSPGGSQPFLLRN